MDVSYAGNLVGVFKVLIDAEEPHAILLSAEDEEVAVEGGQVARPVWPAAGNQDFQRRRNSPGLTIGGEGRTVVGGISACRQHAVLQREGRLNQEVTR